MTSSCTSSHKYVITGHRVHKATRGNGRALPKFVIYEVGKCQRCGDEGYRERGTVRANDAREAAELSGLPKEDWPAAEPASNSDAIEAPLVAWPFKTSAHKEPRTRRKRDAV
jgi:hypothetical protein